MAADMINLRDLVEKPSDADLPHEMIGFAAERMMELEVTAWNQRGKGIVQGFARIGVPIPGTAALSSPRPGVPPDMREHPMRYRTLGPGGPLVSGLCLGTMTFDVSESM